MTTPSAPAQHTTVAATYGSRLEQLAAAYGPAKAAADEAKARLDTITDAIKLELTMAAPGANKIDLQSSVLDAPLRLATRTSVRLDSTRLKTEQPDTYAAFAKQTTYWELRAISKRGAS